MKKLIVLLAVAAMSMSMAQAQNFSARITAKKDSIATATRLNALQSKKVSLQREIKVQDSKRNRQISGVSAETLEKMNDKQDSLCLALRSDLVDVVLEIKELSSSVTTPQLINQYNNLVHHIDSVAHASEQPAKPTKPTKPTKPAKKRHSQQKK